MSDAVDPLPAGPGLTLGPGDPWYGPTDLQVVTAIQSLGLDIFPFGAYDPYGRLKVSPAVTEQLKRELADVMTQPVWADFFKVLSLFDNPGYDAFALGFRGTSRGVQVLMFRDLQLSMDPRRCATLQASIAGNLLPQLREYAGRRYVVQPRWLEVLRKVLSLVGGGGGDTSEQQAPADDLSFGLQLDESATPSEVMAAIGWKAALGIVLSLLETFNQIGRSARVDATVVWRYPSWVKLTPEATRRWSSVGTIGAGPTGSCTGVILDRASRTIWHWQHVWPWPGGHPFAPASRLQSALYPSGFASEAEAPADLLEVTPSS